MEMSLENSYTDNTNDPIKISITLPTNAYFVSGIRDFTLQMVKNMTGFSQQWAYRFQAVVDELCNNAIEHGSKKGEEIHVSFQCTKDKSLEIIVHDTGTGPEPITPKALKEKIDKAKSVSPASLTSLRGRGLPFIVSNWSDELEFLPSQYGGIQVHVTKYLDADAREASHNLPDDTTLTL